jgi:hypothetical protein
VKELRSRLKEIFEPVDGWCYQRVLALPAVDEIELDQDRVTLVISEPHAGAGLRQELRGFWEQTTWQNRVTFLTGARDTYDMLIDTGKRLRAIQQILDELEADKVPDSDPQMTQAKDLSDSILLNFHSAVRETFTTLWYPIAPGLISADFSMWFEGNKYSGEHQILQLLREKMKFEEDVSSDTFRKKCEQRLFTTQSLPWREIKQRAATNIKWQWHHPSALDDLKADCLHKDIWREEGGYVDKGPFPQPQTSIVINEQTRDDETGEVTLKLTPVRGDTIYYDVGGVATTASARVDGSTLKIKDLKASFLVVDSTSEHETGEAVPWQNRITLKHRIYQSGANKCMELRTAPEATIHYTTDGSDPKVAGALYEEPFIIPKGSPLVLAYAEHDGVALEVEQFHISWDRDETVKVDAKRTATWKRRHGFNVTRDSYGFLARLKKHQAQVSGLTITISGEGSDKDWIELTTYEDKRADPTLVEECLEALRKLQTTGQVQLVAEALHFNLGRDLLDWVEEVKTNLQPGEVKQ